MRYKIYKIILWLGVVSLLIFPPIAQGAVKIWSITPVLLIELLLIFLWLWKINNHKTRLADNTHQLSANKNSEKILFVKTPLDKPIWSFALLAIFSFIFSIYKHDSFFALLKLFGYIGIYYLIVNEFNLFMKKSLLFVILCFATCLSFYGFLQYFGFLDNSWWGLPNCLSATYVNHNHFSGYLEMLIPIIIVVFLSYGLCHKNYKLLIMILLGLALTIMSAAYILAQSRGGWISLGSALFIMNIILLKKKFLFSKNLMLYIFSVVIILSLAYISKSKVSKRIENLTQEISGETSIEKRIAIWKGSINMIQNNALRGTGIGTFVWGFTRYRPITLHSIRVHYAYNEYLHMAAEMGLLAPLIMLWGLIVVIITGYRSKKIRHGTQNTEQREVIQKDKILFSYLIVGCTTGVLSLAIHGLTDFNFHIPANMLLFTVILGIMVSFTDNNK